MPKKIPALNAKSIRAAEIFLSAADPVMTELIARQSGRGLQSRKAGAAFSCADGFHHQSAVVNESCRCD